METYPGAGSAQIPAYVDMMSDEYRLTEEDLEGPVSALLMYPRRLSSGQRALLLKMLGGVPATVAGGSSGAEEYGANFDLREEVAQQIRVVRALRDKVAPGGVIDSAASTGDMKEVVSSSATLLTLLMKTHSEIMTMDRLRNLEKSVIEVLLEESPEIRDRVMSKLEERLG